jgi:cytoskeleton protein RodZ
MSIEGLGKKFQEARHARNLTLDEAARITKIRPARLAEIEAEDFSQFPSLAYAKGFLLIYGKFLDVDVTPYLEAFEDSERVTVDGYSYLQDNPPTKPVSAPKVRPRSRRSSRSSSDRVSPMPLIFGILVLVIGFSAMKLIVNLQRIAPGRAQSTAQVSPSATPVSGSKPAPTATGPRAETTTANVAAAPATPPSTSPQPTSGRSATAVATISPAPSEPEVRRAKPVGPQDIAKARGDASSSSPESNERNQVSIRPLKRTYVKVTVDDENETPPFERWISPADGPVEFRGKHVSIRVLDPDAVEIKKNGKAIEEDDEDVTVD